MGSRNIQRLEELLVCVSARENWRHHVAKILPHDADAGLDHSASPVGGRVSVEKGRGSHFYAFKFQSVAGHLVSSLVRGGGGRVSEASCCGGAVDSGGPDMQSVCSKAVVRPVRTGVAREEEIPVLSTTVTCRSKVREWERLEWERRQKMGKDML